MGWSECAMRGWSRKGCTAGACRCSPPSPPGPCPNSGSLRSPAATAGPQPGRGGFAEILGPSSSEGPAESTDKRLALLEGFNRRASCCPFEPCPGSVVAGSAPPKGAEPEQARAPATLRPSSQSVGSSCGGLSSGDEKWAKRLILSFDRAVCTRRPPENCRHASNEKDTGGWGDTLSLLFQ
eukprot:1569367-Rhodomonas_salina.8